MAVGQSDLIALLATMTGTQTLHLHDEVESLLANFSSEVATQILDTQMTLFLNLIRIGPPPNQAIFVSGFYPEHGQNSVPLRHPGQRPSSRE